MIPQNIRIKTQSNTTLQEPYAIISQPTTASFIPTETMETNAEKKSLRQTSEVVHSQPRLAEDKETEG